jgi:hypothetical protein
MRRNRLDADTERVRLYGFAREPDLRVRADGGNRYGCAGRPSGLRDFRGQQAVRHGAVIARILLWPARDADHGKELTP